jgi:hypothetical protein
MNLDKKLERYLRVNLLGPGGPSSCEKRIYRAAVSQRLRNTGLLDTKFGFLLCPDWGGLCVLLCAAAKSGPVTSALWFKPNSAVRSTNTRSNYHLRRPVATLSCFWKKCVMYCHQNIQQFTLYTHCPHEWKRMNLK